MIQRRWRSYKARTFRKGNKFQGGGALKKITWTTKNAEGQVQYEFFSTKDAAKKSLAALAFHTHYLLSSIPHASWEPGDRR